MSKNWTAVQSVNRWIRKLSSLFLCWTLFSSQLAFAQKQNVVQGRPTSKAISKETFEQTPGEPSKAHPASTRALKNIQHFVRQYISLEEKQEDKGSLSLYQRITDKLSEFSEGFFDRTQNYDNIIAQMVPEAQLLGQALYDAHILRESIQLYLQRSCVSGAQDCISPQEKYVVLVQYINSIYLPMRSMALIMMDHQRQGKSYLQLADSLIGFVLPAEIFNYDSSAIINFEENLSAEGMPLALKVVAQNDGTYRLQHDPRRQLGRDIPLILQAPASMTYIRALKWTAMKSLLSQIEMSKNLLNESDEIPVPLACSTEENGSLPASIPVKHHPLLAGLEFPRLLMNHGVLTTIFEEDHFHLLGITTGEELLRSFDEEGSYEDEKLIQAIEQFNQSQQLLEGHLDYLEKVPGMSLENGDMYGILPFEQLEKADFALYGRYGKKDEPYFDDLESFDFIYSYLMKKAVGQLQRRTDQKDPEEPEFNIVQRFLGSLRNYRNGQEVPTFSPEQLEALRAFPAPPRRLWGSRLTRGGKQRAAQASNTPPRNYGALKSKLSKEQAQFLLNTMVFWAPGDGGENGDNHLNPDEYRGLTQWQVELMERHKSDDLMSLLHPATVAHLKARTIEYGFTPYSSSANMKRLSLEELLGGLKLMEEELQKFRDSRPKVKKFWDAALPQTLRKLLKVLMASPFRTSPGGPTGDLGELIDRVISLIDPYSAMAQSAFFPHKSVANEALQQAWPSLRKIYRLLVREGAITPERVSEYDYIWGQIYGAFREKNPWAVLKLSYYLARQELDEHWGKNSPVHAHYDAVTRQLGLHHPMGPFFAQKVLPKRKDRKAVWNLIRSAHDAQNSFLFRTPVRSDPGHHYYDLLQYVATTPVITKERFYKVSADLFLQGYPMNWWEYKRRGDRYFDDILFESADDLYQIYTTEDIERKAQLMEAYIERYDIDTSYSPKRHFLQADFYSKNLIYQQLMRQAAHDHRLDLQQRLKETCLLTHDEIENYRHSFHTLASQQQVLGQRYGLEDIPKAAQNKVDSMDSQDMRIMEYSGGFMAGLMVAFIMSSAGCVFTAGLGCAVALAVVAGGTGWMGYKIFEHTMLQYFEAKDMTRQMQAFKNIGMTTDEGIKEVHVGPWWMIMEGVLMVPLVNFFAKFFSITARSMLTWGKAALRGEKVVADLVVQSGQANALYESMRALGLTSFRDDLKWVKDSVKNLFTQIYRKKSIIKGMRAHAQGGFQMTEFQHIQNLSGKAEITRAIKQTLEAYFKGDLKKMHHTLLRYRSGGKLARYQLKLAGHRGAPQSGWHRIRARRMEKLIDIQHGLHRLVEGLSRAINRGDSFASFVGKNLDDLSVLKDLPMKPRELPHMFLMQGGPMTRSRVFAYENIIEGFMLKRMMTSYNNLLDAHVRRQTAEMLTGKQVPLLHSTYQFMEETFKRVDLRIEQGHLGPEVAEKLATYQLGLAKKVSASWLDNWHNVKSWWRKHKYPELRDKEKFWQLLFSPQNHQERALAEVIWNSTKLQNLMEDEHLSKFARRALRELNKVKKGRKRNLDDLDLSFRLMRIQMASGRPEMLQ